jgi:metal-dependent HD superfamily phosphatase/phosphodiesterase
VDGDQELHTLWACANVNAVERAGITDHGEVHIKIVTNIALKLVRLLIEGQVPMGVVQNHGLTNDEAELVVVLAACLHDLGISIHRNNHEQYSLFLAERKARELLDGLYGVRERTVLVAETLHAVAAHRWEEICLTTEAGVLKVADALDITEGRSRIPFESGKMDIHAISALAIDRVEIHKGDQVPIVVEIAMNNSAGIFQVDELLKRKLRNSSIAPYVHVVARIEGETGVSWSASRPLAETAGSDGWRNASSGRHGRPGTHQIVGPQEQQAAYRGQAQA